MDEKKNVKTSLYGIIGSSSVQLKVIFSLRNGCCVFCYVTDENSWSVLYFKHMHLTTRVWSAFSMTIQGRFFWLFFPFFTHEKQ